MVENSLLCKRETGGRNEVNPDSFGKREEEIDGSTGTEVSEGEEGGEGEDA